MRKCFLHILAIITLIMAGCTEQIDTSARYVFKEETIASYLSKHEQYSEYFRLLSETAVSKISNTTVSQLLSARGHYTIFAPTNKAIQQYLDSLCHIGLIPQPSWDAFPSKHKRDSIAQIIVFNSIIDSGDDYSEYQISNLPVATSTSNNVEIPLPNMNDRKLVVQYTNIPDSILVGDCAIDQNNRDILCINGVIHSMHGVIAPSNDTMDLLLRKYIEDQNSGFVVSAKIVQSCGLFKALSASRDEEYESRYQADRVAKSSNSVGDGGNETFYTPEQITMEDVMAYLDSQGIYPEAKRDKNYESEDNLLYQFITYHLLPERLSADKLVYHYNEKGYDINRKVPSVAVMEYYTTMGKRRLLKLFESRESEGVYLNRFPILDNGRQGSYHELSCPPEREGIAIGEPNQEGDNNIRNGIIYPIRHLLACTDNVRNQMMNERIRIDVATIFPEMLNNDLHGIKQYWANMQGDEMSIRGLLECTMRLPPVPRRGTYELRFAIQSGGYRRGMVQFYWGSNKDKLAAMGIPMDLRQTAENTLHTSGGDVPSDIGYERDTDDDDFNAEVDKRLRNNGFMKGCNQYCAGAPGGSTMMRASNVCIRRIIIRETMDPDVTYYIKFKTVMDDPTRFFYMDYLEYCAKEVYDNPETPEDIW